MVTLTLYVQVLIEFILFCGRSRVHLNDVAATVNNTWSRNREHGVGKYDMVFCAKIIY